jgi:cytochrome c oxidase subunit II
MKRDTIPGKTNRVDITIDEAGTYVGKCAEFCGLLHEEMEFTLEAVKDDEFEQWLSEQRGALDGDG